MIPGASVNVPGAAPAAMLRSRWSVVGRVTWVTAAWPFFRSGGPGVGSCSTSERTCGPRSTARSCATRCCRTGRYVAALPWAATLERHWTSNRDEALRIGAARPIPALGDLSPDHGRIAADRRWKSFFLQGYGYRRAENCA